MKSGIVFPYFRRQILRVRATDSDQKAPHNQVTYELNNDYFTVNKEGVVSLKKSLLEDGTEEYRVKSTSHI